MKKMEIGSDTEIEWNSKNFAIGEAKSFAIVWDQLCRTFFVCVFVNTYWIETEQCPILRQLNSPSTLVYQKIIWNIELCKYIDTSSNFFF